MPAILSSLNIVYQYHSGVLFECCFCEDIAFENTKSQDLCLSVPFFFARMHVGGKIYHLAIHIINNVPV